LKLSVRLFVCALSVPVIKVIKMKILDLLAVDRVLFFMEAKFYSSRQVKLAVHNRYNMYFNSFIVKKTFFMYFTDVYI
jgi:hypothetical protein